MKKEYDFSKGKRGAIIPTPAGKTRITIRLDSDIIDWFRNKVELSGGGNYQTMINNALREFMNNRGEVIEEVFRRVMRQEMVKAEQPRIHIFSSHQTAVNELRKEFDLKLESIAETSENDIQHYLLANIPSWRYSNA